MPRIAESPPQPRPPGDVALELSSVLHFTLLVARIPAGIVPIGLCCRQQALLAGVALPPGASLNHAVQSLFLIWVTLSKSTINRGYPEPAREKAGTQATESPM